jgi:hypothetical protein
VTLHEVCMMYVICAQFGHVEVLCSLERIFDENYLQLIMAMSHVYMSFLSCWRCLYGILGYLASSMSHS